MADCGAWMPWYVADYLGDTQHLDTLEHGAYCLLLMTYWRRGKALPDDDKWLATVTGLSLKRWKKVRQKIVELFSQREGHLIHKRVEEEIVKASARLKSARVAGKAGGLAKAYLLTLTVSKEEETAATASAKTKDDLTLPACLDRTKGNGDGRAKRGRRLPVDWEPSEQDRAFAQDCGLSVGTILENFRDYWAGIPGQRGTKLDWSATWRNRCRDLATDPKRGGKGGREDAGIVAAANRVMARKE